MRAFLLSVVLVALAGCSIDGANGEKGVVRFSQVVNYKETTGFDARIAQHRTILVRLEHANTSVSEQRRQSGFPELTLKVDGGAHRVFPLGFGQFGVLFESAGSYTLVAEQDGQQTDRLKVNVAAMRGLRFSPKGLVTTIFKDTSSSCVRTTEVDLAGFVLRSNQALRLDAIPLDDEGQPMIGFLSVRATASSDAVTLDTPLFYEGGAPNTLAVGAGPSLGSQVTITAIEENGVRAAIELGTADEEAPGTCN